MGCQDRDWYRHFEAAKVGHGAGGREILTGTNNDGISFLLTAMYCGSESVEMAKVLLDAVGSK